MQRTKLRLVLRKTCARGDEGNLRMKYRGLQDMYFFGKSIVSSLNRDSCHDLMTIPARVK